MSQKSQWEVMEEGKRAWLRQIQPHAMTEFNPYPINDPMHDAWDYGYDHPEETFDK